MEYFVVAEILAIVILGFYLNRQWRRERPALNEVRGGPGSDSRQGPMATVKQWTRGRCAGCERHRSIYGGLCVPCRQPEKQRALVDHGVPPMSADCLARLVRRCRERKKTTSETQTLLEMLHPILMENVRVTGAGSLLLRDEKQIWIRRGQWQVGQIEDPS